MNERLGYGNIPSRGQKSLHLSLATPYRVYPVRTGGDKGKKPYVDKSYYIMNRTQIVRLRLVLSII